MDLNNAGSSLTSIRARLVLRVGLKTSAGRISLAGLRFGYCIAKDLPGILHSPLGQISGTTALNLLTIVTNSRASISVMGRAPSSGKIFTSMRRRVASSNGVELIYGGQ